VDGDCSIVEGVIAQDATKHLAHIPAIVKQAQAYVWFGSKACEFQSQIIL
jgi:hypothetical protein